MAWSEHLLLLAACAFATEAGAGDLGIQAARHAHIIAVEGDPLQDVTTLEHVRFVMKGGKVVRDDK